MYSRQTPWFTKSLAVAGAVCSLLTSYVSARAQTAPRYYGQGVDGIGRPGYLYLTDSGVIYNWGYTVQEHYGRWTPGRYGQFGWESGVGTTLTRPPGIQGYIISANDAGMILWSGSSFAYLQYTDGTFATIAIGGSVNPHSLNALGTVAVSNGLYNDQRLTNPLTGLNILFPIEPHLPLIEMRPTFVNNSNHAAANAYGNPVERFAIYYPDRGEPTNPLAYDVVPTPLYDPSPSIPPGTFRMGITGFNDHDEVVGGATNLSGSHTFLWLPKPNYGLDRGFHFIDPNQGHQNVIGFNNRGHILSGSDIYQNGVWYPVPAAYQGRVIYALNNAGQILMSYLTGTPPEQVYAFYLLTQYINIHGHLNNPGNPPAQISVFFQPNDGSAAVTRTVTPSANGDFVIENVPTRSYSVTFTIPGRLRRRVDIDATQNNDDIYLPAFTLPAGDANGDNAVDISDLLILIAHYNQTQSTGNYLEACDFNADGANDITDLLLLIANYNQFGS